MIVRDGAGTPSRPYASAAMRSNREPRSSGPAPSGSRCASSSPRTRDGAPRSPSACRIAPAATSAAAMCRERSPGVFALTAFAYCA